LGEVWIAEDARLGRRVALKILNKSSPDVLARFQREALTTAALDHPNIVRVLDYFIESDVPYLVMELLDGVSLSELVNAVGRLDGRRAACLMADVASGLDFAHARGVIHRDIKPGNIQVVPSATGGELAKILDFGIAHVVDATTLTREGSTLGTPAFMAPEQTTGERVDARTDVFAAGVTLYYALAARVPYSAKTPRELLAQVGRGSIEPLRSLRPDLDSDLVQIVDRALSFAPDARHQTAGELRDALLAWAATRTGEAIPTLRPTGTPHVSATPTLGPERSKAGVGVALGIGAVVLAGALVLGAIAGAFYYFGDDWFGSAPSKSSAPATATTAPGASSVSAPEKASASSTSSARAIASGNVPRSSDGGPTPASTAGGATGRGPGAPCTDATACSPGLACVKSVCACADPSLTYCGTRCINMQEVDNCGTCGNKCTPDQRCFSKKCISCAGLVPFNDVCAGKCTELQVNNQNCGQCFHSCPIGHICASGQCK
jgi:serine/threonine-protein kinase